MVTRKIFIYLNLSIYIWGVLILGVARPWGFVDTNSKKRKYITLKLVFLSATRSHSHPCMDFLFPFFFVAALPSRGWRGHTATASEMRVRGCTRYSFGWLMVF